ncbi:MAG: HD domain-containing protein [Chloroflexia bacterium]|nr:HD domain-containing protein [Chloroflexia bacterium]
MTYRNIERTSERAKLVRDALYDVIELTGPDLALIETSAFIRLDGIQQLGFVSRVWPGAKHTRYEHSLGVLHLTRLAVGSLREQFGDSRFSVMDARTVIAAALLHDIGHYPYSHAIEELGAPILTHESVGRGIIEGDEIATVLESTWRVDPVAVAAMIHGEPDALTDGQRVLRGLLSGTLDMDKLDYLPRDAHGCSVPYGGVDARRLLDSLTIVEWPDRAGQHPGPRMAIGDKGVSSLHSLINARQEMFDNVYWHHTNRACMVMLLRAVQDALVEDMITPHSLTGHDDASLLAVMRQPDMPSTTRHLAEALAQRTIHKRAVEVSAGAVELYGRLGNLWFDPATRRQVELHLSTELGNLLGEPVSPTAILIDIPKPERWRTDVWVSFENPPVGIQPLMHWRDVVGLDDDDFKRYEEHRRLIRVVTEERYRDVVADRWEQLLYPLLGGAF